MTQEEKQLLLKDLCARLPYGVKGIIIYDKSNTTFTVEGIDNNVLHLSDAEECYVEDLKPYLRPMSSMTEEEEEEFNTIIGYKGEDNNGWTRCDNIHTMYGIYIPGINKLIDWFNTNHFDYRGLIPMGLAIAVTEENNPYE